MRTPFGAGGGALLLVAVAAVFGGRLFLVAVLLMAVVALFEMSAVLSATGPRPVVVAAAVAALGTPVRAAMSEADGLGVLPPLVVAMLLLAFVAMILAGRRSSATAALGATAVCGLLIGLGAGSLILLERLDGGWRWVIGLVALVAVAELAVALRARRPLPGSPSLRSTVAVLAVAPAVLLLAIATSS